MRWPRSLMARNALLIATLVIAGQILSIVFYVAIVQIPRATQLAELVGRYVSVLESTLSDASPKTLHEISALEGGKLLRFEASLPQGALNPPRVAQRAVVRRFLDKAGELMGERQLLLLNTPPLELWIEMEVRNEKVWFVTDADALLSERFTTWILLSLAGGLIGLAGAFLIQRRINRPLGRLVSAAKAVGSGDLTQRLEENGPTELSSLARVFNRMVSGLAFVEKDRALMLAGISHDIRTPLTRIRLASELLRNGAEPELLERIDANLDRVDRITGQFLSFARDESTEAAAYTDINLLVAGVINGIEAETLELRDSIKFEAGTLPQLSVRPLAIARAIENLINNALSHGAPPVTAGTRYDGGTVAISILDRGNGIVPDEMERLKQPFQRQSEDGSGTAGLGLAIADRIARLHGGELLLSARRGGGLVAEIKLPVA
jgi:two-component system, OmpR family, osmolarity sensor histidine kinase EnvZ